MTEKPKKTPKEELECPKKYVYDTGIIFECKDNIRVQVIGEDVVDLLNELATKCSKLKKENEQLKQQKPFLKIHDDYFIQYGDDKELFNLHKPSDIRSLFYLINRENGYDELECEYNEEGYGND